MSTQSKLGRSAVSRLSRLHAAQGGSCFYCAGALTLRLAGEPVSDADATIDHFFPKAAGGPDGWGNWVLACKRCNHAKASRQPTREEMQAWNELAAEWQFIRPIDMDLVQKKRCAACGRWISPVRLGESIRAGAETNTCRSRCGRNIRGRKAGAGPELVEDKALPVRPASGRRWLRGLVRWFVSRLAG
jgi:hypothetical protein